MNDALAPRFHAAVRKVFLHLFTLDDHHKALFGVFGRPGDLCA